jgi:hypothetical protein
MAAEIYELNDFQYQSMYRLANLEHQLLMSIDVKEEDDEATKTRLTINREKCYDLVGLGLVEDKTGDFAEQITASAMKIGRGYRVFLPTPIGQQMFAETMLNRPN